jgi:hypothetical protein
MSLVRPVGDYHATSVEKLKLLILQAPQAASASPVKFLILFIEIIHRSCYVR